MTDAVILTQEQLEERLIWWQKVLRLQDWCVKVRLARERDFCHPAQGESEWVLQTKVAIIRVLDSADYSPYCILPQDMEKTLVHELLHLHFAPFNTEKGTAEDVAQEQAIDCIATGLVALCRNMQPCTDTLRGDSNG